MNKLENLLNTQPRPNLSQEPINQQKNNIILQFMRMDEQKRAETIADILNQQGITKNDLEKLIKKYKK